MPTLDLAAVHAFVLIADLRNFTRTAEATDSTQSAVSLKIKKLERDLGQRLLDRSPRAVHLTDAGERFLAPARDLLAAHDAALRVLHAEPLRIVVGVSAHVVGTRLPILLRRLSNQSSVVIETRVLPSREILELFREGALDAAVVLYADSARDRRLGRGKLIARQEFGWMGTTDFAYRAGQTLPVATQGDSCGVRQAAISALAAVDISWTETLIGDGIPTIAAAAVEGLAVAPLGRRVAPSGTVDLGPHLGLPKLPTMDVVLYTTVVKPAARAAVNTLSAVIHTIV
ncbi:DNA-binding transcriptional LysR family regulator [Mycobacterium sp. MAA66]|uniref:LysR family transcriptional regulator n=1 Tax=Mycobacterium sp. MAA66 TaxID=3156297 RepID=UPI0035155780